MGFSLTIFPYLSIPSSIVKMEVTRSSKTAERRTMGDNRNAYKVLVGKPEGKRPLGRSKSRRKGNINLVLMNRMGGT
jgi:hypothetical protein